MRLREAGHAGEVVAVSVGPDSDAESFANGARDGRGSRAPPGCRSQDLEPLAAAKCLAAVIRREKPDVVLMGKQSTDHDYGQTPAMLAGILGWPQALQASQIQASRRRAAR